MERWRLLWFIQNARIADIDAHSYRTFIYTLNLIYCALARKTPVAIRMAVKDEASTVGKSSVGAFA
jgi:hypothetical protein